jgi:sporulation protein YlmC with PRC-barrel domain
MDQRTHIQRGMTVMSYDGVQLGRVIDVTTDGIIVEKGALALRDLRIPFSEISTVRGDEIILVRDHAAVEHMGSEQREGTAKGTVGVAGFAAPPPQGGLGLGPTDLSQARMDSAKFQDHGQYELGPTGDSAAVAPPPVPQPHEPPLAERRAAGPGWDPLSVDEELEKEAPRAGGPDTEPPTRY